MHTRPEVVFGGLLESRTGITPVTLRFGVELRLNLSLLLVAEDFHRKDQVVLLTQAREPAEVRRQAIDDRVDDLGVRVLLPLAYLDHLLHEVGRHMNECVELSVQQLHGHRLAVDLLRDRVQHVLQRSVEVFHQVVEVLVRQLVEQLALLPSHMLVRQLECGPHHGHPVLDLLRLVEGWETNWPVASCSDVRCTSRVTGMLVVQRLRLWLVSHCSDCSQALSTNPKIIQ